jgi:hypothetical protein
MAFSMNEVKVVVGTGTTKRGVRLASQFCDESNVIEAATLREAEISDLVSILNNEGIKTECDEVNSWVRDKYVFRNGLFYSTKDCGYLAVGGLMLFGEDCILTSAKLPSGIGKTREETKDILCKGYDVTRVYFMPPHQSKDHIDLYLLLLPDIGVLVTDIEYYDENKRIVDEVVRKEQLNCIRVPRTKVTINSECRDSACLETDTYPTNSLDILDDSGTLLIFTAMADNPSPLREALREYKTRVIEVPFARQCLSKGSIRCKTNFVPNDYSY